LATAVGAINLLSLPALESLEWLLLVAQFGLIAIALYYLREVFRPGPTA